MIGRRWTIWKLSAYGSGVHGPDTEHDPELKGVEALRSAEVDVMPVANLYADEIREAVAKILADQAVGGEIDRNHISMFDEEADGVLKAIRAAVGVDE